MNIIIEDLSFDFKGKKVFENLSLSLEGSEILPAMLLGPSGCGKTTLLRIIAGLLPFAKGTIRRTMDYPPGKAASETPLRVSFVFQEPRFLPWLTILENIALPLEKEFGKNESRARALHYLEMVSLEDLSAFSPEKLSGGQRQRASIARAFAYPSELLLMDEPFQSLDIPLRIELMDLCVSLLEKEKRLSLVVTHDPREAVYMGSRIIILGSLPKGIIFDEKVALFREERSYGSMTAGELEKRLIKELSKEKVRLL
jgi:NitT/TauT family transport system ATP-binding protein